MGQAPTDPYYTAPKPTTPPVYTLKMPTFTITPDDFYQRKLIWPSYVPPVNWNCGNDQSLCFSDVKHVLPAWSQPKDWMSRLSFGCAPICGETCKSGYVPVGPICNRGGKSNLADFLSDAINYATAIQHEIQEKAVNVVRKGALMVLQNKFNLPKRFTLDEDEFVKQMNIDCLKYELISQVETFFTEIKDIIVGSQRYRRRLSAKVNSRVDWSRFITLDIEFEASKGYSGSGGIGFLFNTRTSDVKAYAFMCVGAQTATGFGIGLAIGFWDDENNVPGWSIEIDLTWDVTGIKGTKAGVEMGIWYGQPSPFSRSDPLLTILKNIRDYKAQFMLADMWAWGFSIGVGAGDDVPISAGGHMCVTSTPRPISPGNTCM